MVSTTIQVSRKTRMLLELLKREYGVRSFDEVIERLVFEKAGLPMDMFGVDKGRLKPFSARDRMEDRL